MNEPRFAVGTRYVPSGLKVPRERVVVDVWKTYDRAGNCVKTRYVSRHDFIGQEVLEYDVLETTIARGLVND